MRAGCLGQGLRSSFSSTAKAWSSILLDKLKEKNTLLCTTVVATLSTWMRHCASLAELAEDFAAAADHKHPKVKLDALTLLKVRVPRFSLSEGQLAMGRARRTGRGAGSRCQARCSTPQRGS